MKTITTIYQLETAMCELARNPHLSVERRIQYIQDSFKAFMPQPGYGTYSLTSYAGEGDDQVQVTYEIDSDGDACELKVFSDQGEITKHLHGNTLSRMEQECNAASIGALAYERDEARISRYEASREYA